MNHQLLREAIADYLALPMMGLVVETADDPTHSDCIAIRTTHWGEPGAQFLLTHIPAKPNHDWVVENLEEVEFTTWPPTSGQERFL